MFFVHWKQGLAKKMTFLKKNQQKIHILLLNVEMFYFFLEKKWCLIFFLDFLLKNVNERDIWW